MGHFSVTRKFSKTNSPNDNFRARKPNIGEEIKPDKQEKAVYVWNSNYLNFPYVAKIIYYGKELRATTNKHFDGPSVICFLKREPQIGEIILITQVDAKSVFGKLIPRPKNL